MKTRLRFLSEASYSQTAAGPSKGSTALQAELPNNQIACTRGECVLRGVPTRWLTGRGTPDPANGACCTLSTAGRRQRLISAKSGHSRPIASHRPLMTHIGLWERPLTASNYESEDRTFESFRARRKCRTTQQARLRHRKLDSLAHISGSQHFPGFEDWTTAAIAGRLDMVRSASGS